MESNDTTKMSRFDVATYEEMVQRGGFIPIVLKPKFSVTGNDLDGSDGGYNYIVPLEAVPAHRTESPLMGNGSPKTPYAIDMDALRKVVEGSLSVQYDNDGNIVTLNDHGFSGMAVVAPMEDVSVNMIHAWESDGHPVYLYRTSGTEGSFRDYYVAYAGDAGTANAYRIEVSPNIGNIAQLTTWAPNMSVTGYFNAGADNGDSTSWTAHSVVATGDFVESVVWDGVPTVAMVSQLLGNMQARLFTNCGLRIRWRASVSDSLGWSGDRDYYLATSTKSASEYDSNTVQRFVCIEGSFIHLLDLKGDGTYVTSDVSVGGGGSPITGQIPIVVNGGVVSNNGVNNIASGENSWSEGCGTDEYPVATAIENSGSETTVSLNYVGLLMVGDVIRIGDSVQSVTDVDYSNSRIDIAPGMSVSGGEEVYIQGGSYARGSHTEGCATVATGVSAHAEGYRTLGSGESSHAEGNYTVAAGDYAHSEGFGYWSYVDISIDCIDTDQLVVDWLSSDIFVGSRLVIGSELYEVLAVDEDTYTITLSDVVTVHAGDRIAVQYGAYGSASHSEGESTVSSGTASHSEGYRTYANSVGSHAEGRDTEATSASSHAEGDGCVASGINAHAEGKGSIASEYCSHAEGSSRATEYYAHSEGRAIADGYCSHAEGDGCRSDGQDSHAEGHGTMARRQSAHAEGTQTVAAGWSAHAEGYGAVVDTGVMVYDDPSSGVERYTVVVDDVSVFVEGDCICFDCDDYDLESNEWFTIIYVDSESGTIELDGATTAENWAYISRATAVAYGDAAHSEGRNCRALGYGAHAGGDNSLAYGICAFSHGSAVRTTANYGVALGAYNMDDQARLVIGNGEDGDSRSDCFKVDSDGKLWFMHNDVLTDLSQLLNSHNIT